MNSRARAMGRACRGPSLVAIPSGNPHPLPASLSPFPSPPRLPHTLTPFTIPIPVPSFPSQGVVCSLRQLLQEGFFHADPHPGNLVVTSEGQLAYFDFGMMSQLSAQQSYGLIRAVRGRGGGGGGREAGGRVGRR